jgi:HPt (histidine-containing phosphotransfer) domain-containing protein
MVSGRTPDSPPAEPREALDLAVLRAQTGGDAALEREVLGLFLAKSEQDFARIASASSVDARRAPAHSLVGSARAVGARDVARLAALVEASGEPRPSLDPLRAALTEAQDFIRRRK